MKFENMEGVIHAASIFIHQRRKCFILMNHNAESPFKTAIMPTGFRLNLTPKIMVFFLVKHMCKIVIDTDFWRFDKKMSHIMQMPNVN